MYTTIAMLFVIIIILIIAVVAYGYSQGWFNSYAGNAVVDVYADNFVDITLNGIVIKSYKDDWTNRKTLTIPGVKAGDTIGFVVTNVGGPGGLIGSITWNNKTVYTSPTLLTSTNGTLIVPPADWLSVWAGPVPPTTFPNSQWVWTSDLLQNGVVTLNWKVTA